MARMMVRVKHDLLYKELAYSIIGAGMEVHKILGPGFLEEIYQKGFEAELRLQGIEFESQKLIKVSYKGSALADYFLDLVVDGKIVVELKAVGQIAPVHKAQVLSYLKASGLRLGLLFNFGEASLKFERIVL
jgi:GxxExxY protein